MSPRFKFPCRLSLFKMDEINLYFFFSEHTFEFFVFKVVLRKMRLREQLFHVILSRITYLLLLFFFLFQAKTIMKIYKAAARMNHGQI